MEQNKEEQSKIETEINKEDGDQSEVKFTSTSNTPNRYNAEFENLKKEMNINEVIDKAPKKVLPQTS